MTKPKIKYIVRNLYSGEEYETFAVSEADAINHIHYNLWFLDGYWTEMDDYEAVPESIIKLHELLVEHEHKQDTEQYHQMTLFEVAYDS